jgi:hypothetical protein
MIKRTRAKGYADWRPQEKTLALVGAVRAILEEYQAHLPLTIRQVFYRLVGSTDTRRTRTPMSAYAMPSTAPGGPGTFASRTSATMAYP